MLRSLASVATLVALAAVALAAESSGEVGPVPAAAGSLAPPPAVENGVNASVAPEEIASSISAIEVVAHSPPITLTLKADLGAQQVTVLEGDTILHVWPISSGVQGYATPTGIFQPQWATKMWYSRQYDWAPMPHAVFFTRGVAFHGTNAVWRLGKSASHGCLRLAPANAAQLYTLVRQHGFAQTRVIVYGTPKHGPPPPSTPVAYKAPRAVTAAKAPSGMPDWARSAFRQ